jgi:tRNA(Phe) wybutosine-synthesizing methylase Tyw3
VDGTLAIQYGALGAALLVAIAAVKVLFNREVEAHKREQERADRLEAELKQLNELVRTQYVEKLAVATQTIGEALTALRRTP